MNGSVDESFAPGVGGTATTNVFFTLLLQPDGKVVAGGFFNTFVTTAVSNIARMLNVPSRSLTINNVSLNEGGNTITVTTQTGCAYTAASNNNFIVITSGGSGSGSGTVTFTVAANAGAARTGTITVAGRIFTVNQAAAATFRRT